MIMSAKLCFVSTLLVVQMSAWVAFESQAFWYQKVANKHHEIGSECDSLLDYRFLRRVSAGNQINLESKPGQASLVDIARIA